MKVRDVAEAIVKDQDFVETLAEAVAKKIKKLPEEKPAEKPKEEEPKGWLSK